MRRYHPLLARPRISVISTEPDRELARIAGTIRRPLRAGGPDALARVLGRLSAEAMAATRPMALPRTLDLIGHSAAASSLLRLGDWTIDAADPAVAAWFGALAAARVLPRLGIARVRLLGCRTAAPGPAQATLAALRDILGVEVLGTEHLLHAGHYDEHGFCDRWQFLLRAPPREAAPPPGAIAGPRALDLDALPVTALPPRPGAGPMRIATPGIARQIVALIDRAAGARMPGPAPPPCCELALARGRAGAYCIAHLLFDGAFVRFFPDGPAAPGVVYPVDDAPRLRRIVHALPALEVTR